MENVKKIKLNELIEKLNKRNSQNAKDVILKTIEIKDYIGYAMKEVTARQIIQTSHFIYPTDKNLNDMDNKEIMNLKGVPSINYSKQYLFTALMLVDLYTNIEIDFSNGVNEYDKLAKYGIMDYIISNIEDSEIKEFRMLIDYEFQLYFQNHHSVQAYVNTKFNEMQLTLIKLVNSFTDGIQSIISDKTNLNNIVDFVKDEIKNNTVD